MKKLIVILMIILWAGVCFGADQNIYIDADAAAGGTGTESSPYDAFADINWTTGGTNSIFDWVAAGDDVCINLTGTFNETLTVGASGTVTATITIQSYSDGATLTRYGEELTDWEISETNVNGDVVYKTANPNLSLYLMIDRVNALQATDNDCTDGTYKRRFDYFYFVPPSGDVGGHEVVPVSIESTTAALIELNDKDYVTISDLTLQYDAYGIYADNVCNNITISDNTFNSFYGEAVRFNGGGSNIVFDNNTVYGVGNGFYALGSTDTIEYSDIIISNNNFRECNYNGYISKDGHAVGLQRTSDSLVYGNYVDKFYKAAFGTWSNSTTYVSANNIYYANIIKNSKDSENLTYQYIYGTAFSFTSTAADMNYGHVVTQNYIYYCASGLSVTYTGKVSTLIYFTHNTIDDCDGGIRIAHGANNLRLYNNIMSGTDNAQNYWTGSPLPGSDIESDYNIYTNDNWAGWLCNITGDEHAAMQNLSTWQSTINKDLNSSIADPLMKSSGQLTRSSPAIDAGDWIIGVNDQGYADPWGKYLHRLPNIGADQGAGTPIKRGMLRIGF